VRDFHLHPLTSERLSLILYGSMAKPKHINEANDGEFLTVEEAGKELGVKTNAIRNYLYNGKMQTYKFKTLTLIKREDVEQWKARQRGIT